MSTLRRARPPGGGIRGRLGLMVVVLASVGAYGATRVLTSASGASPCSAAPLPAVVTASPAGVARTVTVTGVRSLVGSGRLDVEGVQVISAVLSDQLPATSASLGRGHEGYEVRWWSPAQDHQAVDEFVFARAGDARDFVSRAGSADCRRSASSSALRQPAGARALIWVNPESAREADVFFASGRIGYRVVEVPPGSYQRGPARLDSAELSGLAQRVACRLARSACPSGSEASLSPQADAALRLLTSSLPRLEGVPPAGRASALGRVCQEMGREADPETLTLQESCQAIANSIIELWWAHGWQRDGGAEKEAANLRAAADDTQRVAADQRTLADELEPGLCRAGLNMVANTNAERAGVLLRYVRGLTSGRGADLASAWARERLINAEGDRESSISSRLYQACRPTPA